MRQLQKHFPQKEAWEAQEGVEIPPLTGVISPSGSLLFLGGCLQLSVLWSSDFTAITHLQSFGLCVLLHHDPFALPPFSICYLHTPQISPSFRGLPLTLPPGHLPRPFQCQEPPYSQTASMLSFQGRTGPLCSTARWQQFCFEWLLVVHH